MDQILYVAYKSRFNTDPKKTDDEKIVYTLLQ
jgi:hypothetical protein